MIVEVDLHTFESLMPRQNLRAVYIENDLDFILLCSLDSMLLRNTTSKMALFAQMKADMESTATDAAKAQGLEVDSSEALPDDNLIMEQAIKKFKAEHLEDLKQAIRIVEPEIIIRGL